jgi:hypothetical protein
MNGLRVIVVIIIVKDNHFYHHCKHHQMINTVVVDYITTEITIETGLIQSTHELTHEWIELIKRKNSIYVVVFFLINGYNYNF